MVITLFLAVTNYDATTDVNDLLKSTDYSLMATTREETSAMHRYGPNDPASKFIATAIALEPSMPVIEFNVLKQRAAYVSDLYHEHIISAKSDMSHLHFLPYSARAGSTLAPKKYIRGARLKEIAKEVRSMDEVLADTKNNFHYSTSVSTLKGIHNSPAESLATLRIEKQAETQIRGKKGAELYLEQQLGRTHIKEKHLKEKHPKKSIQRKASKRKASKRMQEPQFH
jgi:hypothetical protein